MNCTGKALLFTFLLLGCFQFRALAQESLIKKIDVDHPISVSEDGKHWMQVRGGIIPPGETAAPPNKPLVVVTMQLKDNTGTHMFHGLSSMWSDNLGKSWHGPKKHDTLSRRKHQNGLTALARDGRNGIEHFDQTVPRPSHQRSSYVDSRGRRLGKAAKRRGIPDRLAIHYWKRTD